MKYFALALALLASPVWGQDDAQHIPVKHPELGKWGIIDINGDWVLPPRFEAAVRFSEGLAVAKDQGKFGYINESGDWVLKPSLEDARSFSEGLAALQYDGKWGYVDTNFDWVIGPSFEFGWKFINGHAIVRTPEGEGIISRENWVFKPDNSKVSRMPGTDLFLLLRKNEKGKKPAVLKGLIHPTKGLLFDAADQDFSRFGNGLIIVKTPEGAGVYDPEAGWVIEPTFKHLGPIGDDGLAPAIKTDNWGLMDISGNWVLEPEYRRLSFLSSELLSLAKDELHYLADYSGTPVTEPRFMEIGAFRGGLAKARNPGGDVSDYFDEGHKWGLIDKTGAWVVEPKFNHISPGNVLETPLSACTGTREDYECGFIDKTGAWVVEPPVRAKGVYKDGTAIVQIDKSVGVVGLDGEWILPANYKTVSRQDGVFVVETKDKQTLYFRYDGSPITFAPVN